MLCRCAVYRAKRQKLNEIYDAHTLLAYVKIAYYWRKVHALNMIENDRKYRLRALCDRHQSLPSTAAATTYHNFVHILFDDVLALHLISTGRAHKIPNKAHIDGTSNAYRN